MRLTINQFTFADSIFNSQGEVIEAAISWHFQNLEVEELEIMDSEEWATEIDSIADNLLHPDYNEIEWPDGDVRKRGDLKEDIANKIDGMYNIKVADVI